jgi:hypothetical protein
MALRNLAFVTETLVKLIDEAIKSSPAKPSSLTPEVTALPPDALTGDAAVGMYLYHLAEDAGYKNQVWSGRPQPPMRYSPMGLNLYYVLSAHSDLTGSLAPYCEQLLMGIAVKALHDYPIVDDATSVNSVTVLHADLRHAENPLRIELRHLPPGEAVSYWTAGSRPLRLSAYYEVRMILLEPEEPAAGGGRVLTYGIQSFVGGLPHLETSRNKVKFRLPTETTDRVIEVQPAVAAPGTEVTFMGINLSGDAVSLQIRAQGWPDAVALDPAWGVVASSDRLFATVQLTASGRPVLPGAYTAAAKVVRQFADPAGATKTVEQVSNQTPFTIVPAVTTLSAPVDGVFTLTGATFVHPDPPASLAVDVIIGGTQLQKAAAPPAPLAPGRFRITSPTTILIRFPADAVVGSSVPVRVVVNGAESLPQWVKVA